MDEAAPVPGDDAAGPDEPVSAEIAARLVENHRRFLAFLERRVGSRELAEDILQDAFVRGIDRASSLRDAESATAWFYRLLRNAIVDHHRHRGAERRALERVAAESDDAEPPLDAELLRTVCTCVGSLVETLPPAQGDAIRRVDLEGVPVRAYAEAQGITPNAAAVRLHRARKALKRALERTCGTCATHGCLDCTCGSGEG